jgi:hypothetical protein
MGRLGYTEEEALKTSIPAILAANKGWEATEKMKFEALAVMLGAKPKETTRVSKRNLTPELFDAMFPGK